MDEVGALTKVTDVEPASTVQLEHILAGASIYKVGATINNCSVREKQTFYRIQHLEMTGRRLAPSAFFLQIGELQAALADAEPTKELAGAEK
ncbi:hypothetical protein [Prochlorococcus marinus]|uniref:hypothetical protein n=1 Tax=Prochlorococcus sp. MIT 1342 TaxID=3082532 RepID=UPI0018C864D8